MNESPISKYPGLPEDERKKLKRWISEQGYKVVKKDEKKPSYSRDIMMELLRDHNSIDVQKWDYLERIALASERIALAVEDLAGIKQTMEEERDSYSKNQKAE